MQSPDTQGAVVPTQAAQLDADQAPGQLGYEAPVVLGRLLRYGAAIASLGAAAIHASAIAGHTFHWLHALTFIGMTVFQAWWAYLILRSSAPRVLLIGALVQGAIVGLWLLSRTVGIPDFLPGGHRVEAVGLKDGVATLFALVVIGAIDALSRRDVANRLVQPSTAGSAASAFLATVVLLGASAVLAGGHVHGDMSEQTPGHPHPTETEEGAP